MKIVKLFSGGCGRQVLMRTICLDVTNAGKDDGVPTSLFREYSALAELQHPNIARLYGVHVDNLEVLHRFLAKAVAKWSQTANPVDENHLRRPNYLFMSTVLP